MALEDGRKRFKRAAGILVEEKDRIKDRLLIAYASQLSLIDAREDLPHDMVDDFCTMRNALSDAEMAYGSGEHAAEKIQAMDEDEASLWASKIFAMCLELCGLESNRLVS